jgi:hypothetical protein
MSLQTRHWFTLLLLGALLAATPVMEARAAYLSGAKLADMLSALKRAQLKPDRITGDHIDGQLIRGYVLAVADTLSEGPAKCDFRGDNTDDLAATVSRFVQRNRHLADGRAANVVVMLALLDAYQCPGAPSLSRP